MKKILITIALLCGFGICHQLQAQIIITGNLIPLYESATGANVPNGGTIYSGNTYCADMSYLPTRDSRGYGYDDCFAWFDVFVNGTVIYTQLGIRLNFTLPSSVAAGSKVTIRFNGRGVNPTANYTVASKNAEWDPINGWDPNVPGWGGNYPVYPVY